MAEEEVHLTTASTLPGKSKQQHHEEEITRS